MSRNAQSQRCGMEKANGAECTRPITQGSGCWQHKNGKLFVPKTGAKTKVLTVADVVQEYDEFRPPLRESHNAANWRVPAVKGAAARLAEYTEHLAAVKKYKGAIEGLLEKKFNGQEGDIKIGEHTLTVGRTPENFSAKKAIPIFEEEGLGSAPEAYSTPEIDLVKLKAEYPDLYTEFSAGRGGISLGFSKDLKDEKKKHYAEMYDPEKLKNYPNERLVSEYRLLSNEQIKYESEINKDKKYLENALPVGTYDFDNDYGGEGHSFNVSRGNRFDRKAFKEWTSTDGSSVNISNCYSPVITATSIKKGDKLNGTSYYTKAKDAGKDRFSFAIKE